MKLIIFPQIVILLLIAIVSEFWLHVSGLAIAGGFLSYALPADFFFWRIFKGDYSDPKKLVVKVFLSEFYKIIISAILLILLVKFVFVLVLPLVFGYISSLLIFWVLAAVTITKK